MKIRIKVWHILHSYYILAEDRAVSKPYSEVEIVFLETKFLQLCPFYSKYSVRVAYNKTSMLSVRYCVHSLISSHFFQQKRNSIVVRVPVLASDVRLPRSPPNAPSVDSWLWLHPRDNDIDASTKLALIFPTRVKTPSWKSIIPTCHFIYVVPAPKRWNSDQVLRAYALCTLRDCTRVRALFRFSPARGTDAVPVL